DPETRMESRYYLREMWGTARDEYLDSLTKRMDFGADGKATRMKSFKGLQANLIARCLYNSDNELVTMDEIQSWPSSVQSKLYAKAREINGLDEEETEGND